MSKVVLEPTPTRGWSSASQPLLLLLEGEGQNSVSPLCLDGGIL